MRSNATSDAGHPAAELERLLGGSPPASVRALDPEALSGLADAVRAARRRQADDLTHALGEALHLIPRPLRGVARKLLGA
jgi:hypothetical protein